MPALSAHTPVLKRFVKKHTRAFEIPAAMLHLRSLKATLGASKIGGAPDLPSTLSWPTNPAGRPMEFIAQIDFSEAPAGICDGLLPAAGHLYFFYDVPEMVWGFDPADHKGFSVLFSEAAAAATKPPAPLPRDFRSFPEWAISLSPIGTVPDFSRLENIDSWQKALAGSLSRELTEDETLDLADLVQEVSAIPFKVNGDARHQLGGAPYIVQNDCLEIECAVASNGYSWGGGRDAKPVPKERAEELKASADDWMLLLQIDSDDRAAFNWCDDGVLYLCIRRQDLQVKDFSRCWVICQSH